MGGGAGMGMRVTLSYGLIFLAIGLVFGFLDVNGFSELVPDTRWLLSLRSVNMPADSMNQAER